VGTKPTLFLERGGSHAARGRDLILPSTEFGSFSIAAWVGADWMILPTVLFIKEINICKIVYFP
jgi:hypothetical protein